MYICILYFKYLYKIKRLITTHKKIFYVHKYLTRLVVSNIYFLIFNNELVDDRCSNESGYCVGFPGYSNMFVEPFASKWKLRMCKSVSPINTHIFSLVTLYEMAN